MRATRSLLIVLMLALAAACAPKTAPPPATPGLPRYPEYVFPKATPGMSGAVLLQHENAWRFLQAGDLRGAERGFTQLTKRSPDLYPAHAGLGYAALARKDHKAALEHFNHALTRRTEVRPGSRRPRSGVSGDERARARTRKLRCGGCRRTDACGGQAQRRGPSPAGHAGWCWSGAQGGAGRAAHRGARSVRAGDHDLAPESVPLPRNCRSSN